MCPPCHAQHGRGILKWAACWSSASEVGGGQYPTWPLPDTPALVTWMLSIPCLQPHVFAHWGLCHQGAFLLSTCIPLLQSQAPNGSERVKWGYTIALRSTKDSRFFYGSDSSDNGIAGMVSRKDIWTQLDTCPRAQLEGCKPKQRDASRHREEAGQRCCWWGNLPALALPESVYMSEGARTHIC